MRNMRRSKTIAALITGVVFLSLFLASSNAWPQFQPPSADQATKDADRPIGEQIEKELMAPPKKPPVIEEEVEKEPEGPTFFVKKIRLEGVATFPEEDFKPIVEKYENRNVALSELEILAKEIERAYLKKGVIAACFVPPQDIREGVVTLRIIEAQMGELKIKDHRYFFSNRIAYYWPIKPGEILRYDKISRSLQLMNTNPDRFVKVTLHAGKKPKTTDVILEAETTFPLHLTASLDREGGVATGRYRKGIGFVNNNFLGLDDTLMGGYTGQKTLGGIYVYHRLPITNYGTSLLYGYNQTRAFPKKDYEFYDMSTRSESASIYVYQDLYRKDEYKGEIKAGLEAKNKLVTWNQGTLNNDRLRIVKLGGLLTDRGAGNVTYLRPELSQGMNFLGARRRSELSSRDASNTFFKANLGGNFRQAFPAAFQASLKFQSQFASQRLMSQEEFQLGGINSVRGYPGGDFMADTGFSASAELLVPCFILPEELKFPYGSRPLKDEITGVLFFDYGYGQKRDALVTDVGKRKLASVGAGVRIRLLDQALLRLEWGRPLDAIAEMPITEYARTRFHFSIDFQDRFPEELERVYGLMKEDNIKHEAWAILNKEMKDPESLFRKRLYIYLYLARTTLEEGNLRRAKEYYVKIATIGRSAYRQAENYVRETIKQTEELKKHNEVGARYYKEGKFKKAKEVYEKIKEEAKIKPLVIELL